MRVPPDPLTCSDVAELIEAFVDDELVPDQRSAVAHHVGHCPACAAEVELATEICRQLHALPQLDPPGRVVAAIRRLLEEEQGQSPTSRPTRLVPAAARMALAAAAALALAATVVIFGHVRHEAERDAAIARTAREARYALAWIAVATRRASTEVRQDVVTTRLAEPALRVLDRLSRDTLLGRAARNPKNQEHTTERSIP